MNEHSKFRFYVNGVRQQTIDPATRHALSQKAVEAANRYYQAHPSEYAQFAAGMSRDAKCHKNESTCTCV